MTHVSQSKIYQNDDGTKEVFSVETSFPTMNKVIEWRFAILRMDGGITTSRPINGDIELGDLQPVIILLLSLSWCCFVWFCCWLLGCSYYVVYVVIMAVVVVVIVIVVFGAVAVVVI